MVRLHLFAAIGAIAVFLSPACNTTKTATDGGDTVVATVNGVPVTEAEVAVKLQQMGAHGKATGPEMRSRAVEEILEQELMYQKGKELGLDKDAKFRNAVRLLELRTNEFKRSEMERQIRNTQVAAKIAVNQDDVRKYYDEHAEMIAQDLHLAAIRFANEEEARVARERIQNGTSFETVARERSPKHPGSQKSPWNMGYVHWNQIPMEWVDSVYALKRGETSAVLSSARSGIFIVKMLGTRSNPEADFSKMSASIMNRLRDVLVMQSYDRYVDALRKNAKIVRMEERRDAS